MIRCREIGITDLDAVANLLTFGFARRSRNYTAASAWCAARTAAAFPSSCSRCASAGSRCRHRRGVIAHLTKGQRPSPSRPGALVAKNRWVQS
jgi:hypothetical protein